MRYLLILIIFLGGCSHTKLIAKRKWYDRPRSIEVCHPIGSYESSEEKCLQEMN